MDLEHNPFEAALKVGEKQLWLWISLCSGFGAEVTAPSGFDWALIDMEHSPNDFHSVLAQLQVFASYGTTAIVRPDWNDTVAVKRLLDLGAQGLLFPMIQSVDEAEQAVAATRYPPRGVRGVSGNTRANKFGRVTDYAASVDGETTVMVQLETTAAIAQAEAIGTVDGVSGVFFGPADIAADMGLVGQPMNAAVWDVIKPAAQALIARGVPVGTLVTDPNFAAGLLNDGFNFVACGSDTGLLAKASDALLETVKGKMKE